MQLAKFKSSAAVSCLFRVYIVRDLSTEIVGKLELLSLSFSSAERWL